MNSNRVEEESLKLENKTRIESNKVELLQQQNEELAKQLQEIKSKVDVIEGYKQVQLTSSDQIDNNLQRIESSLVILNNFHKIFLCKIF